MARGGGTHPPTTYNISTPPPQIAFVLWSQLAELRQNTSIVRSKNFDWTWPRNCITDVIFLYYSYRFVFGTGFNDWKKWHAIFFKSFQFLKSKSSQEPLQRMQSWFGEISPTYNTQPRMGTSRWYFLDALWICTVTAVWSKMHWTLSSQQSTPQWCRYWEHADLPTQKTNE